MVVVLAPYTGRFLNKLYFLKEFMMVNKLGSLKSILYPYPVWCLDIIEFLYAIAPFYLLILTEGC